MTHATMTLEPQRVLPRVPRLPVRAFGQRDTQKRFALLLLGKMLGLIAVGAVVIGAVWFFENAAGAQTADPAIKASDLIDPLNTVWVLVAAFLVFFMQAGFMALEAGFARS